MRILKSLLHLLYPPLCQCCGEPLVGDERMLCISCQAHLPYTYHFEPGNFVEIRLGGRIPLAAGGALLLFSKGNPTQTILHQIKYHGKTKLAIMMGRQLGIALCDCGRFDNIDIIVPVPLHWIKKWKRGYNQSELLAKGIAQKLNRPIVHNNLYRKEYTATQTHKNREAREHNMEGVFGVHDKKAFEGKHILLVDDIITTGATSQSCFQALKDIPGLRISVVSLAIAQHM